MSREIKYRAWNKAANYMVNTDRGVATIVRDVIMGNSTEHELMQYTGLKDQNDKEIYECDIVEGQTTYDNGGFRYKGKVVFYTQNNVHGWHVVDINGGGWEIKQLSTRISLDNITGKVLGNIYENPELLEE